ncbi:MAG: hypothetical protein BWY82_02695 [Verrucomicrobia bacterium ADurb.Bin474]|nr:MAG: hypothetical protein BWY82_02695 [Verrucomicrobia bacterium ADurb.Bin474]
MANQLDNTTSDIWVNMPTQGDSITRIAGAAYPAITVV